MCEGIPYYRKFRCNKCKKWATNKKEIQVPSRCCNSPWERNEIYLISEVFTDFVEEGGFDDYTVSVLRDFVVAVKKTVNNFNQSKKEKKDEVIR